MEERKEELEKAIIEVVDTRLFDEVVEEVAAHNGFRKGVEWADSHPSLDLIKKIIDLAYSWDSLSPFDELAKEIKEEIWQTNS